MGVVIWAGVFCACAVVLASIFIAANRLRAVAAMWRPIALIVAAAYLLFANAQGRELGISLMEERNSRRLVLLFLALIYWAANNWHTARLGLSAAVKRGFLPTPASGQRWPFWPPRLLGVCAHLFAAINLSLAAQAQPAFAGGWGRLVAWMAPIVVVTAFYLAWRFDGLFLSKRSPRAAPSRVQFSGTILAALLFIGFYGVIAAVSLSGRPIPPGFAGGTFCISISAVVFLIWVSWLRRRAPLVNPSPAAKATDDARESQQMGRFTGILFLIAFVVACVTWTNPVVVGRAQGSMVVAYAAFGAVLATVNALEWAIVRITARPWFGRRVQPWAAAAYAVAFMVAFGVLNAWLRPFHQVRPCDGDGDCVAPQGIPSYATEPDKRPSAADAARVWYAQAKAAYDKAHGEGPVPMLIVTTAGGGIRAAYWTATVLEKLTTKIDGSSTFKEQGGVRPYLFAISGVSGGSVGAAAFEAALAKGDETACRAAGTTCPLATSFLTADFLAPALASLVFVDGPSSLLPDLGQIDRGTALERSFEKASGGVLVRPFLSLFPYKMPNAPGEAPWRPILLLNGTHEETGKRIIAGHILIERDVFIDSIDLLDAMKGDVRASTAAHNSARFTYVSPAGDLGGSKGSVIDGGYFENYGALSALELGRAAEQVLNPDKSNPKVRLLVLMISSDPGLENAKELVRINEAPDHGKCLPSIAEREAGANDSSKPNYFAVDKKQIRKEVQNAWINEFFAPFEGITKVREAHGNRAAAELALQICAEFTDAPGGPAVAAPASTAALPSTTQSPFANAAEPLAKAKTQNVDESKAAKATDRKPYFAHLAMCTEGKPPPVQPPLGWVLSSETRKAIDLLLDQCGNTVELNNLAIALGAASMDRTVASP